MEIQLKASKTNLFHKGICIFCQSHKQQPMPYCSHACIYCQERRRSRPAFSSERWPATYTESLCDGTPGGAGNVLVQSAKIFQAQLQNRGSNYCRPARHTRLNHEGSGEVGKLRLPTICSNTTADARGYLGYPFQHSATTVPLTLTVILLSGRQHSRIPHILTCSYARQLSSYKHSLYVSTCTCNYNYTLSIYF